MIVPFLASLTLAAVMVIFLHFFPRYLNQYRLSDTEIEFIVFGKVLWKVPYNEVLSIEPISIGKALLTPSLHFASRPFSQHVLLRRKKGIFRSVLMTPEKPDEFLSMVRQKTTK
jgi:hypothetical protein